MNEINKSCNLSEAIILDEINECWFEIKVLSNLIHLKIDPLFSKLNLNKPPKNILFIPREVKILKQFKWSIDIEKNCAIFLKDIELTYIGMDNLNSAVIINYSNFYFLNKGEIRIMKIENMLLNEE